MATSRKEPRPTSKNHSDELLKLPGPNVLSRAKQFLPLMMEADKKLKEKMETLPNSELDIENVTEDEPHIEMNIALVENDASDEDDSSSDSSGSDFEMETEYLGSSAVTEDNFKTQIKGKKPVIEEIISSDNNNCSCLDEHKASKS
ncbi:predicted protein [Nematostella vectensis]|uniref:Uncharacterized protein n=1 Tax=Nematostella vectensis TaxID=45351 RepID=A7T9A5_NEMVE|nr:predicted protein [Nematostella vectensis]|eukprot:XP_001619522.1 hypothetical protein NEMVEDRAFT_v1g224097 [Nematostella vectensis]